MCGDAMSFMRDCRALLDAAEGRSQDESLDEVPMYLRLPVSQMSFLKGALPNVPVVSPQEEAEAVNVTAELLSSPQSDTNMLGMESLAVQTDPSKTLRSTAVLASKRILCPSDPGNKPFSLHNYVMSLLDVEDDESEEGGGGGGGGRFPEETSLADHTGRLRNLAMSSLSNALSLLAGEGLLDSAIAPSRGWYASVLVPKLLSDLASAGSRPHDACYASRCLATLAESSPEFADAMREVGGHDAIKAAEEVGVREFALLARDAGSCHKVLRCCV